jgi:hypothetical protein
MFDPWEQRRQKVLENTSTKKLMFRPLSEILKELPSESSEDRLEALPDGSWTPALFIAAARALLAHSMFAGTLHRQGDALPALGDGVILKYAGEYETYIEEINDRTDLVVSVVREGDRVIAFAGAELRQDEAEIKLVAVDDFSRRQRGVGQTVEVGGQMFNVGLGHAVVDLLTTALPNRIVTDATGDQSRYIFKSLGFKQQPDTSNPCLLQFEP